MADSQKKSYNLAHDILIQKNDTSQYWSVLFFDADLEPDTTYTLSIESTSTTFRFYTNGSLFTEEVYFNTENGRKSVTVRTKSTISKSNAGQATNGRWIILKNAINQPSTIQISNIMLNVGSTAKPYGWVHSLRKQCTATETIQSGDTIYADGTAATVSLKGNTTQSGTPSPSNPITIEGCGDKTANLFDMSFYEGKSGITVSGNKATGTCDRFYYVKLSIPPELYGQELTWSAYLKRPDNPNTARLQTADNGSYKYGNNITGEGRSTVSFTATSTIRLYVNYGNTGSDTIELSDITLNLGSTALPFEPFGVKIPISSASTTTPVYLGEVETTRRVKKLVLTGQEGWTRTANQKCYYINLAKGCPADYLKSNIITVICSHYAGQKNTNSGSNEVNEGCVCFFTGDGYELYIGESTITSATDFKAYLAAQYAAGTPVTVWYILATETTGIVNEPLRKIGDYADTVSGITIPTIAGADSFDVLTTLKPSEAELTYTGWHNATVKEWDGSQWNE